MNGIAAFLENCRSGPGEDRSERIRNTAPPAAVQFLVRLHNTGERILLNPYHFCNNC